MEEIWKDIPGYEGLYQASNFGNIKRICYTNQFSSFSKEKILKQHYNEQGYLKIKLTKKGKPKTYRVHRLIAQTFIPNPYGLKEINHIDSRRDNNCVNNLEWCDRKSNILHSVNKNRMHVKPVRMIDNNVCFKSIKEASNVTGICYNSIESCCRGLLKTAGKLKWEFIKEV